MGTETEPIPDSGTKTRIRSVCPRFSPVFESFYPLVQKRVLVQPSYKIPQNIGEPPIGTAISEFGIVVSTFGSFHGTHFDPWFD
jgi:hypothetical protein